MNEKDRREILKNMTPEQLAKANELYDQIKRFAEPEIDYENMTMDKINEYLLRHGYDPEQVGLRGKILADALIENVDLRAEVARLTELQQAASEFIGYIKAGNNAKAHLQMLFLEVLINEESKNGAKK